MFYSDMIPEVGQSTGPAGDTSSRPVVELLSGDGSIGHGLTVTGEAPAVPPAAWILLSWQAWLVVLWLVVVIVQVSRIVYQRLRLRRLLRGAAAASEKLTALTEQLASQVGLRHTPATLVTKRDVSPFVCGVLSPRIVLPQDLHRTLNSEQLQQVILHELSHVKRGDLVWGWLPEIARIVYFFHPLVYWMNYRIRLERELACDQAAIAASGRSAPDYADTLVKIARQSSVRGPRLGVAG